MSKTQYNFSEQKCYERECQECGVAIWRKKIETDPGNVGLLNSTNEIRWLMWEKTGLDADGKPTAIPQLIWKTGTVSHAFETLCTQLEPFALHRFNADWHRLMYSQCKSDLVEGVTQETYDFSQNLTIRMPGEVQSAYWDATSVTIHGVVAYYKCPTEGCDKTVTHDFLQLSNDKEKDSFLPRLANEIVLQELLSLGVKVEMRILFSDNCPSQYKSQRPFVHISQSCVPTIKIFFGEKHGKSPCDAMFSTMKKKFTRIMYKENCKINKNPFIIRNSHDLYQVCKLKLEKKSSETDHHAISFAHVGGKDLQRNRDPTIHTVEGTKLLHSVMSLGEPLKMRSRKLGCCCQMCIQNKSEICENKRIVDEWKLEKFVPKKSPLSLYAVKKRPAMNCSKII
jgi:hypothetical protein